jgi:undecaprenyl-diphosphatase
VLKPKLLEDLRKKLEGRRHGKLLEGAALVAMLLIAMGVWAFVKVATTVMGGGSQAFDERILLAVRDPHNPAETIGPHFLKSVALDITALGGVTVLVLVTLTVAGYLALEHKRHAMWLVLAASIGGQLMSTALKMSFDRPRPSVVPRLDEVMTTSFPSGHSLMSAVVYLTLGALLTQFVKQRRARIFIFALACMLTFLVGLSRVFLGVHYPTDVLAGWTAGLVWALVCWLAARVLQQTGKVEQPGTEPELRHEERESLA